MAYTDQYALGELAAFQQTVQVAILTQALAVVGELLGAMSETVYQKRQSLALRVIASPQQMAQQFARLITTAASVTISTPDATIQTIVTNNWNKAAGVNVND